MEQPTPAAPQQPQPPQGMQVTLEELYQVIGEKEMVRFKLQAEVNRLTSQVEQLQGEILRGKNGEK
jgi:uncharacterized coiled-coil protein SlyX